MGCVSSILVVDDEPRLRQLLRIYLEEASFAVMEAGDGDSALRIYAAERPALVVLDIMLPAQDGWTVARRLREQGETVPIIMLTAKSGEEDRIQGFELGADDYVCKPFSPRELVMRVKALLRRSGVNGEEPIRFPLLSLQPERRAVLVAGEPVDLTAREYDLLHAFVSHRGKVLSRQQLLDLVWGYDFLGDDRTVDAHVKKLRQKLGVASLYVHTVWGIGYKFEVVGE